ncbi:MAG TPA: thioredoxin domain-containing protein [Chloroflexi bacterium]|nr:thioredoxin domain-containing protein [Chloroflexota bacterium]
MANQLASETSPYLLQHAENPVDWYPWGEEALQKAHAEGKPIFLSIGYSACHWCHVMAHESFEDGRTAAIMNQHFVNVKVDREERPDLDRVYMSAVQALTGQGGWPMSVFLTPDGRPFYGGTYFPPEPRYGMPSFADVLLAVADAWQNRRPELLEGSDNLVAAIERQMVALGAGKQQVLREATLGTAFHAILESFDWIQGGWGQAPKFPQPMTLEFLLRYHHTTGNPQALEMVKLTLDRMARGGMYDQLGGGFHRYSVDAHWTTPHFEKMLYDNAQLARVYLHAWQVTNDAFYRTIAEETLDYVTREMAAPEGGFYATQDADSEGEEGKFFLWTPDEIRSVLGDQADRFLAAYGVTEGGNFEGQTILELKGSLEERQALDQARHKLLQVRAERIHPGRDEKVLTSWNGLMLAAFATAARVLGRDDYRQVAERNAEFLLRELMIANGRLYHTWRAGEAKVNGYLEDYTYLIEGLLELYQATFDPRWYQAAHALTETMIEHLAAPVGFFDTSDDHEELIVRPRELQDNAVPSGNGMAALVLQRLAGLAVEPRYLKRAREALSPMQELLARYPLGFSQWLVSFDYALAQAREIAIIGQPGAKDTRALLHTCFDAYRPHQMVAVGMPTESAVPLLQGRKQVNGRATAYVCANATCSLPVTTSEALRQLIEE